jgi:hypothetical protein
MSTTRPHIVVNDLRVGWGSRVLMEHVTFDVERGTTFAILGGSGSGKSTLLRCLIGLKARWRARSTSTAWGHRTSTRAPTVWRALPVQELVQAKLDLVGLGPFADHLPGQISGGVKKLARAMMPTCCFSTSPRRGSIPSLPWSWISFADEARSAIREADVPGSTQAAECQGQVVSVCQSLAVALIALASAGGAACLKRPDVAPARMIEPRLVEPAPASGTENQPPSTTPGDASATNAIRIRLLDTQARGHIGRRPLHQQPDGELIEDPVWLWSSAPDRYLDSALRLALSSSRDLQFVDTVNATTMGVTLVAWHLESTSSSQLDGAVEVVVTRTDRTVSTQIIRGNEPVSGELPDDLADAAGRLLQALAAESLSRAVQAARETAP